LDENRDSYSLESYVKEKGDPAYKTDFWEKYNGYEEASEEDKVAYGCQDIIETYQLYRRHLGGLHAQGIPNNLVTHVHRLQASLLRTEIDGIRVDLEYLEALGVKLKHRIDELDPQMRSVVRDEIDILELEDWQKKIETYKSDKGKANASRPRFSFESTMQLQRLLYGRLNLPVQRGEKTKSISTDFASLEKIKSAHPVIELIQENRELQKIYGAYIQGTVDRLDGDRIYPQFRVNGTATGRISHNSPNMAQLPKSGGVRAIYVPDPGRLFISADYSQLEVIMEANLTGDKNLIRMLENGESKHDVTARELGCSRDIAKTLNFALQYWCTAYKVTKLLGVSSAEGERVYNKYWEVYSGSKALKTKTDKMVDDGIPLVTAFGRKRRFEIKKRNQFDGDYRQAYNFLIQGTGADLTSRAFYLTDAWLRKMEYGKGLFTVHDELIIQVRPEFAEVAEKGMLNIMTSVGVGIGLTIPLKAESSGPMECWRD
jgi:DNA polymerase I-like protein with 3'-5' exonuclease and polymerase domains